MRASFHHHQHDDENDALSFSPNFFGNKGSASFQLLKKAGRHEKGAGRRALQKRPRQNTVLLGQHKKPQLYV